MKVLVASLFVIFSALTSNAQWQSSQSNCYAYTDCYSMDPYGRPYVSGRISCQTYGSSYVYGPGATQNACQWFVVGGASVQCQGYTQVANAYGQFAWAWQNFRFTCPGNY